MKWEQISIGKLYDVHNGLSKGRKFFGKGEPFISFATIFNNWFLPDNISDLVESTENEQQRYSICRGDVLITRTSETMDELGMSSVALKDYPKATFNGFSKRLRPKNLDIIYPEYIGYYFRSFLFRNEFRAFSSMTTRASLKNEELLSIKIALPTIEIQKKVASILQNYDKLIKNNQKQIKLLEEMAQRLYKEWFVKLKFPGHDKVKLADGIPEGWQMGTLSNIGEFKRGKTLPKNAEKRGNIPVVAGGIEPAYYYKEPNTSSPVITISASGANAGYVNLYYKPVWASDCSFLDNTMCKNYLYLYCYLKVHSNSLFSLQKGSAQPHVYAKDINSIVLFIPSNNILSLFCNKVKPVFDNIGILNEQINLLKEARNRLLPKLINGDIEIE